MLPHTLRPRQRSIGHQTTLVRESLSPRSQNMPVMKSGCESLKRRRVAILSRCAWTLFNFRTSLIKATAQCGAEVIALGAGDDGFDVHLRNAGIDFRSLPVSRRGLDPAADISLFFKLIYEMRRVRPAIVHCFTIKPAIYGILAAWMCRVPVRVATITGLGHAFTTADGWLNKIVSVLYRVALSRAHLVYFQNAEDRELFIAKRLVDAEKTVVVAGSGIDVNRFSPAPLPVRTQGGLPRFLMVARLIREKGVIEFLEAAARVKGLYPEAEFWLLGSHDTRNPSALSEAEMQSLKGSSVVRWMGETADVRSIIAAADVVVLPSYREGLPRALIEAGAMGRPCIASDAAGCRDAVVHGVTGYLVPVKDPVALAETMLRFIERPDDIPKMGAAARACVLERFDEAIVIDSTLKAYERLLVQSDQPR